MSAFAQSLSIQANFNSQPESQGLVSALTSWFTGSPKIAALQPSSPVPAHAAAPIPEQSTPSVIQLSTDVAGELTRALETSQSMFSSRMETVNRILNTPALSIQSNSPLQSLSALETVERDYPIV